METEAYLNYHFTFEQSNSLNMTETNSYWLNKAITLPLNYNQAVHYYDKKQKIFFEISKADHVVINSKSKQNFQTLYSNEEVSFLVNELLLINSNSTNILKIPRLSIEERVAMQIEFIDNIDNLKFYNDLLINIHKQDETSSFVLDSMLKNDKKLNVFVDYWWEFKFQRLTYFINDFEEKNDLDLRRAQLWNLEHLKTVTEATELLSNCNNIEQKGKKVWWRFW
jgi:hypothetical protein